ncbi:hypothetical protein Clacol_002013 [Clathrus columnatus]|uniref:Pentacotripeptide-repeat region of PRORP domain-containing protein n=1 Tax=Clathrus columnatus TaxID=1419009 RepID=A0AAV5A3M0_9AGAM|nr:hypothetical protein Clacol_002013 [Clathrus columnatus]
MLPKAATHFLQHTSRLAAAVQNQTSQAIRNALQLPNNATGSTSLTSWGGVGSSSWGGSSAGPGGAKSNAGSRFYAGYTGPGRTITQANPNQTDDDEAAIDLVYVKQPTRRLLKDRPVTTSFISSTQARLERLGVLHAVQIRAKHAFAEPSISQPNISNTDVPLQTITVDKLPHDSESLVENVSQTPERSQPAEPEMSEEDMAAQDLAAYDRLRAVSHTLDTQAIMAEVQRYRNGEHISVPGYNLAIRALLDIRQIGEPITLIVELYNELLERGLVPNSRTYHLMIMVLCARDYEVQRVMANLEERCSHRSFVEPNNPHINYIDEQRIAQLRAENNLKSALLMFQATTLLADRPLGLAAYNILLRSCALHGNVDAALRIFAHLERFPEALPSPVTYQMLLSVFEKISDLKGAERVFKGYQEATKNGQVNWDNSPRLWKPIPVSETEGRRDHTRAAHVQVWNKMIDVYFKCNEPAMAVNLFDSMLVTPLGRSFQWTDAPLPNALTYTSIIKGFCKIGDMDTAMSWFKQLLNQAEVPNDPFLSISTPPRPDSQSWIVMLYSLARAGKVEELNSLWSTFVEIADQDGHVVRSKDRLLVHRANLNTLSTPGLDNASSGALVDFVLNHTANAEKGVDTEAYMSMQNNFLELFGTLVDRGEVDMAIELLERRAVTQHEMLVAREADGTCTAAQTLYGLKAIRKLIRASFPLIFFPDTPGLMRPLNVKQALRLAILADRFSIWPNGVFGKVYIHCYNETKRRGDAFQLSLEEQTILLKAFLSIELPPLDSVERDSDTNSVVSVDPQLEETTEISGFEYPGLITLLRDYATTDFDTSSLPLPLQRRIGRAFVATQGRDKTIEIIHELGPKFTSLLDLPGLTTSNNGSNRQTGVLPSSAISVGENIGEVHIDMYHSRYIDEWYPSNPNVNVTMAYERFVAGAQRGIYPSPECIGRLIGGIGRLGRLDKVHELYSAGQRVLSTLDKQKRWQSVGWFAIEDQMIIGLAHGGDVESANVHRIRIVDAEGVPSADAYGALIAHTKDTTDDAANALLYWEDAISRGVQPNIFMYNTIISKLAKARRADHAVSIFNQMKEQGVIPSAVTYGAIIAAACRVGDVVSAEALFDEMLVSPKYKLRAPPYNTMIQMYVYTKPDRERALYYYNALARDNVRPTEHTYKLLLDIYGKTEPIDIEGMQRVFDKIAQDSSVDIQGTHWATLINVYGCAIKDLARAIGVFESIEKHPSTARSKTKLPDAVVYEALFDVLSVHRRPDLIPMYLTRLRTSHVRSTAYVSNAVIKGYAAAGDIVSSREIFESMEDPPMGKAAPFNHNHHQIPPTSLNVRPHDSMVVYREPSTWEAMVRAELGVGERERAMDLIRRMESRLYPALVVQRVKDIVHPPESYNPSPSTLTPISFD